MAGKQSIRETNLISEEETKRQTQQSRSESQPMRKVGMPAAEEPEGGSNAHGNQHHAANGAESEDEQVNNRPVRIADGGENKEGYRSGTGQAVNDPHHQGTQLLVETDLAKQSVKPGERRLMGVRMSFGRVSVRVHVHIVMMNVGMSMDGGGFVIWQGDRARRTREAYNVHGAKYDQHESHGKFHRKPDAGGNDHVKKYDGSPNNEDGERMTNSPDNAGDRGPQQTPLATYDGGHRDHVIRIGGVAHPEKKSHRDDGEQVDHIVVASRYCEPLLRPVVAAGCCGRLLRPDGLNNFSYP